ncbi:hypothetical protein DB346_14015 [Verrucomicrobia bacterium LW23]|nr:hypothetical protein DB346_14015 [Verrucomicrobia bacterium LW23]
MQAQLGAMVRTVAAGIYPALEWPRDLEFRLSSFARGSLYLGFELPQPPDGAVFMRGDPFEQSARESLTALGAASRLVATEVPFAQVLGEMPDPRLRDAALAAVERLSPTGRRGIASLSLAGRCFGDQAWRRLTPETRQRARALIESTAPAATCQPIILQGVVRQIDLDQRRFDLRTPAPTSSPGSATASPQAAPLIRCRYGAELDRTLKTLLDSTVEVQGDAEMYDGKPRLVQVRSVRPVA